MKKLMSVLLALALVLAMVPVAASAADGDVARVGNNTYPTLQAAVEALDENGGTITLLADVELSKQVTLPANTTLDGDDHTISVADSVNAWSSENSSKYMLLCTGTNTTIQNVTVDAEGNAYGCIQFYATTGGKVENVTLKNAQELGLLVNASQVTATGTLTLAGNGWGDVINVGWGYGIPAETEKSSFTVAEGAELVGVSSIYSDEKDVGNAGENGSSKFTISADGFTKEESEGTVTYTRLQGDVRFFDVDFAYVPEKTVLHNISLYAKPGQKVAFVGSTGAGKTTITNLINRFYDIADGKIRYDGININKIKKADLRHSLGIVLQDTNLFTGTVMENIRYGNLEATDEECIGAARLAGADDFIRRLPEGYNTMLMGNGANLSQGQRQLLAIARAAVADPPVMILDEATSSIDTHTEAIVQRGMDALMSGRTTFYIAHRLSTIQNADAIMVLDHGRIIERGTHEDLIKLHGTYYQLYTGALELD